MIALLGSGCSASREAVRADTKFSTSTSSVTDSVKVESVAVSDSVMEVTTVTIRENEQGDTLRMTTVTDRTRIRERERARDVEVKTVEVHDTVFVQKTDSVYVETLRQAQGDSDGRKSAWVQGLKWVFWIIVAVIALVLVLRFGRRGLL